MYVYAQAFPSWSFALERKCTKIVDFISLLSPDCSVKAEQRLALEGSHKTAPELQVGGRYHGKVSARARC